MNTFFTDSAYNMAKFQTSYSKLQHNQIHNKANSKNHDPHPHTNSIYKINISDNTEKSEMQKFIDLQLSKKGYLDESQQSQLSHEARRLEMFKEQLKREQKKMKLANIDGKLKSGAVLTPKELDYLKKNNPELYQEAIKIIRQREAYKRQLAQCKTKKDVERLQEIKTNEFMGKIKAIRQSNMPTAKKIKEIDKVTREQAGCDAEYRNFKKSNKFKSLPEKQKDEL